MTVSLLPIMLAGFLSLFSTAVMSYISMATPIGPWIGPTLVLCGMLIFRFFSWQNFEKSLALAVTAGSIGGILATAVGFSFPTIYFLDPAAFKHWIGQPFSFILFLTVFSLVAGGLGLAIASCLEKKVIVKEELPFPIGQLIYKMIAVQNQVRKAYELMIGFCASLLFCVVRGGIGFFRGALPAQVTLLQQRTIGFFTVPLIKLDLDLWPMLLAIGFVTGHVIALPLLVGACAKIMLVDPLNRMLFSWLPSTDFVLAFASGMVLSGTILGFIKLPITIVRATMKMLKNKIDLRGNSFVDSVSIKQCLELVGWLSAVILFFIYYSFSPLTIAFVILATLLCTYEIVYIAGQIGLAPLGRFATFVMVPAMFLFQLSMLQIIIVATFVEIVGGVACDVLFGRKIAHLASITQGQVRWYQYVGLVISACCIGLIFWVLIHSLGLGSDALFAYKAQSRQLLIQAKEFNYYVLILGFIFGHALSYIKMNAMLVLGGLLMPLNISLGLIGGGLLASIIKNKEEWYPLWSGVFAANSIWMLLKALIR